MVSMTPWTLAPAQLFPGNRLPGLCVARRRL